eukprot:CAMPEP_0183336854 /NCGR_PEP_ID=MMETSP0164_2-20130417/4709_1 /TAXON_ID=221442 /ORGANISM="Coccolithus pelagicus ssp braarudi, Strain PLY182g" /LENGTH=119 /DNA_ID=CAMNT_0025506459 /DNA_START=120 /DNA_END=479 /DNA_ORIENTATION=+
MRGMQVSIHPGATANANVYRILFLLHAKCRGVASVASLLVNGIGLGFDRRFGLFSCLGKEASSIRVHVRVRRGRAPVEIVVELDGRLSGGDLFGSAAGQLAHVVLVHDDAEADEDEEAA